MVSTKELESINKSIKLLITQVQGINIIQLEKCIKTMHTNILVNPQDSAKEIHTAIETLASLALSKGNQEIVDEAKQGLHKAVDKVKFSKKGKDLQNTKSFTSLFIKSANALLAEKKERIKKAKGLWTIIKSNIKRIAAFADKGREKGLARYHSEALDPYHRALSKGSGTELLTGIKDAFEEGNLDLYKMLGLEEQVKDNLREYGNDRKKFFEKSIEGLVAYNKKEIDEGRDGFPSVWLDRLIKGVAYLKLEEREIHKLSLGKDSKLYKKGEIFDTSQLTGKNSKGMAAFAIKDRKMYASEHISGLFHHSSFVAGERVTCTGMVAVKGGKITSISNNSNHYLPEEHHMVEALKVIPKEAFAPDAKVIIRKFELQDTIELRTDFIKRAAPLAEKKWANIQKNRLQYYKDKLGRPAPKADSDIMDVGESSILSKHQAATR